MNTLEYHKHHISLALCTYSDIFREAIGPFGQKSHGHWKKRKTRFDPLCESISGQT